MFLIVILLVCLVTALIPIWAPAILRRLGIAVTAGPAWLPVLAAICFAAGLWLPDIHISRETDTFQEHFISGGLYTALLYVYLTRLLGLRKHWIVMILGLFAWTSALGTLNELVEFTITKLHITDINISDTSWDLAANTLGSLAGYTLLRILWVIRAQSGR